jgi:hypothetical protein
MKYLATYLEYALIILIAMSLFMSKDFGTASAIVFAIYWHRLSQLKD